METCPNCGNEIRPTARFCTSCGFRMPERTPGAAAEEAQRLAAQPSGWGTPPETEDTAPQPAVQMTDTAAPTGPETPPTPATSDWSATPAAPAQPAPAAVEPAPVAAVEPAMPSGPVPDVIAENTINDMAENRVNIALFHIERLRQLVPDITGWSEQQASSVNTAIFQLETALKGREESGDPYPALRETVKAARRRPRDIDVMIALADRAGEIEDLLIAHDTYSLGVREALFAIKPAAINYVTAATRRPAHRRHTRRTSPTHATAATTTVEPTAAAESPVDAASAAAAEAPPEAESTTGPGSEPVSGQQA
jgi:hypothetical protein